MNRRAIEIRSTTKTRPSTADVGCTARVQAANLSLLRIQATLPPHLPLDLVLVDFQLFAWGRRLSAAVPGVLWYRTAVATRFAEPARRTFDDAEALLKNGRFGTPDHLYGLACECALKAILTGLGIIAADPPQSPFRSHVDKLWKEYAISLSGRAASTLTVPNNNPFASWKADHRYCDDSQFTEQLVLGHRQGAEIGMRLLQEAQTQGIVK